MKTPNRLINEQSPYLLQHAYNPVDWYPWCDEAFEKAAAEDKPVFFSIGYSTCHWCHVMEKESFEDEQVAALMNDAFVSIKVDREERPDIDGIYMNVCQMLTGSGGWPMTIVMTPEKLPFFAGTYFPKFNHYGRSGMLDLIPRLKDIWIKRREEVLQSANEISTAVAYSSGNPETENLNSDILLKAFNDFSSRYDPLSGGFNRAPKFPTPHNISFLLRYWEKTGEVKALEMAEHTLLQMRLGGIYDHIGGGFHRYSTDAAWFVPHFEKMLYDQALIAVAFTEAFLAAKKEIYKKTAEEIFEYVLRDMRSPDGAFYSAEDADSEGAEGKFYLWTTAEIRSLLKDDAELFLSVYNAVNEGNWIDPVHGSKDGTNILHLKKPLAVIADEYGLTENGLNEKLEQLRKILFAEREKRVHPYKDDKILTDWNGLMISALARAAQAFENPLYTSAAEKCAAFILSHMLDDRGRLLHRYRNGNAGITANADDYAFFISAMLDLYETTFDPGYLSRAVKLNDDFTSHFWDEKNKGYFFSADDSEQLLTRQKEIYDGAVPSANSAAVLNLIRLSGLTGSTKYRSQAEEIINVFAKSINTAPTAYALCLSGIDFIEGPAFEVIITGDNNSAGTEKLISYLKQVYLPRKVMLFKNKEYSSRLSELAPFTADYGVEEGIDRVYVCRNFTCSLPVSTVQELENLLNSYR